MAGRVWLDVPYGDKDAAMALGARWDPEARRWWAPAERVEALAAWAPAPELSHLLPGEDRSFGSGLFVDLVPSSCWFTNARSAIDARDWERVRRMITSRAERRCEACGAAEDRSQGCYLEVHERWAYDDVAMVQTLRRLVCLCSRCHICTHLGYARITGRGSIALKHLAAVNGWTIAQASGHADAAFDLWRRRSVQAWALNLSILTAAGIGTREPDRTTRKQAATDGLAQAPLSPESSRPTARWRRAAEEPESRWPE